MESIPLQVGRSFCLLLDKTIIIMVFKIFHLVCSCSGFESILFYIDMYCNILKSCKGLVHSSIFFIRFCCEIKYLKVKCGQLVLLFTLEYYNCIQKPKLILLITILFNYESLSENLILTNSTKLSTLVGNSVVYIFCYIMNY